MLILMRRPDQSITIDTGRERIKVMLTKIDPGRNQAHIGIEAPPHVDIYRDELVDGQEWRRHETKNG